MQSREIVQRAIEFRSPPRLPFWQHEIPGAPDDVCDLWEMDRAEAGWFFDRAGPDDWGCLWAKTGQKNMGQVVGHPLANWDALESYRPPDGRNPFYFDRLGPELKMAGDRYVAVTCHFNLIERLHMLRGFAAAMEDFYLEPERVDRVLDMILQFKLDLLAELHRRFGGAIHGIFLTDDWGTQKGTFVAAKIFERFFASRYQRLFDAIHGHGWHVILHSCGRINDFVPRLSELGVDVLNMQQPQPRAGGVRRAVSRQSLLSDHGRHPVHVAARRRGRGPRGSTDASATLEHRRRRPDRVQLRRPGSPGRAS